MSIQKNIDMPTETQPKSKSQIKNKRKDDSVFSIEEAREVLLSRKQNTAADSAEDILAKKKNILAQQQQSAPQQKVGVASVADILGFNPIQKSQANGNGKSPDEIPTKYRKYYKLLLKMRDDVKKGLSKLTNENLAISIGKEKKDGIDPEIESFDSEFAISLMSSEQEALTEIEEAIQRIHNGTYGICELTGKPIETERLLAVPCTRYSLEGQKEKEKVRQIEVSRGSVFQIDQSDEELADFQMEDEG